MRKTTTVLGTASAAILAIGAFAHAFVGWPTLRVALEQAGAGPELTGALAVGWYWGSASMATFAALVALATWRLARNHRPPTGALWLVAVVYVVFGIAAYLLRDHNPHFLFFVVCGVLVALFAASAVSSAAP